MRCQRRSLSLVVDRHASRAYVSIKDQRSVLNYVLGCARPVPRGRAPGRLDEDITLARLTALLDVGIRTFVDLTEEEEKMQGYARRLRTLATDRQMDIAIVRIPIRDRGVPSTATLTCVLDLIDRSIANGNPVFVHCFAGVGRTGTMVGCYLMRHGRTTEHDVIAKISELRSLMPGGREPSPHTPEQIQVVKNWKAGS